MADVTITTQAASSSSADGLLALDLAEAAQALPIKPATQHILLLPVFQTAGNHAHAHRECFLGLTPGLEFHWLDAQGEPHVELMDPTDGFKLFSIEPWVPHAVRNTNPEFTGVLYEFGDAVADEATTKAMHVIEG